MDYTFYGHSSFSANSGLKRKRFLICLSHNPAMTFHLCMSQRFSFQSPSNTNEKTCQVTGLGKQHLYNRNPSGKNGITAIVFIFSRSFSNSRASKVYKPQPKYVIRVFQPFSELRSPIKHFFIFPFHILCFSQPHS